MSEAPTETEEPARGNGDPAGSRPKSAAEVRETYATFADRMARFEGLDRLFTGRARARLFETASGRVLDVACGTGVNRRYLPGDVEYVGVDLSPAMLARAADRSGSPAAESLCEMDAARLAFADDSFDTVISSMSTCTFPDPDAALGEMCRVCRPDGRILLLEHGRSSVGLFARFQDWYADRHYERVGCRWNQEPVAVVSRAGLDIRGSRESGFGILTAIEARPGT